METIGRCLPPESGNICTLFYNSHQTTRTQAKRGNWDKFLAHCDDQDGAAAAFLEAKGYQPEVTVDAQVVKETDEHVVFSHRPCPKFRVVVPLQRPWLARNYDDLLGGLWHAASFAPPDLHR